MDQATLHSDADQKSGSNLKLSNALLREIRLKNTASSDSTENPLSKLGGSLAFHCTVNLDERRVVETASMATAFRGYESLLPGRDLQQVGLVSSMASGICGGVHATASALGLEMALNLEPPPLGIVLRNLLLSCQYLNDNTMHLFVLAGPDYSQDVIEKTNPEIWSKALTSKTLSKNVHGYSLISDIMADLNKPSGKLYSKALEMIRLARKAYAVLGGKYPHSESIVPGGVSITAGREEIEIYAKLLLPFTEYAEKTIAIWNDIFDFMLGFNPQYEEVGRSPASMLDFGQWDHEQYYDASYKNCDTWGEKRWSTPGAVINGKLETTRLSMLNAGLEEFVDHSYYTSWVEPSGKNYKVKEDPIGNEISPNHPWNKKIIPNAQKNGPPGNSRSESGPAYSWGTCLTWNRHTFEVGAYARMYISALAQKLPASNFVSSTGNSLELQLPQGNSADTSLIWRVPDIWNAFERNRARAYALAFNLAVTLENTQRAQQLIKQGETAVATKMQLPTTGKRIGVGLWGAGRGFLAHWSIINEGRIDNYQITVPSRVNAGPRSPWGKLGPCERAVLNTPIIESSFSSDSDFVGIDIQRAIQSFDPCMTCTMHILIEGTTQVLDKVVDTTFPI